MENGKKVNKMTVSLLLAICLLVVIALYPLAIVISSFNSDSKTLEQKAYESVQEQIKSEQMIQ